MQPDIRLLRPSRWPTTFHYRRCLPCSDMHPQEWHNIMQESWTGTWRTTWI